MDFDKTFSKIVSVCEFDNFGAECLSRSLTTLCGFAITKADMFPAIASRGTGQILIVSCSMASTSVHSSQQNITLPSLFFSRIVTSISTSNASAIGIHPL